MSKLEGVKHVFFDLDHTLWDFDRNSKLAFETIFEKNKITVSTDEFLKVYSPINFEYWKYYRESRVTKEQLRYGRLKKTFDGLKVKIDDYLINKLSNEYIVHLPEHNHLFEGTLDLLEELNAKYKLHIITNGFEEVQALKLQRSNISHFFQTVTSSEAAGVKKPDVKIFHHALNSAGATVDESVMIGDTYEADILGAQQAGMRTIFFNYHKADHTEERVVDRINAVNIFL